MNSDERIDLDRLAQHSERFARRTVELAGGAELLIDAAAWRDTIVFLQTGRIELECVAGQCRSFAAGAILCLLPPVRVLRNCGSEPARLIAVARRAPTPRGTAG